MREAYASMLRDIAAAPVPMGTSPLTSHWPLVGAAYRPGGVLVVGQAVFGWIPYWSVGDATTEIGLQHVLDDTERVFQDRSDPMDWIVTNRVRNSPFWKVVRGVTEGWRADAEVLWHSQVAWTNLYPVAPGDVKSNPTDAQCFVQRPGAAALLTAVVDALDPGLRSSSRVPTGGRTVNSSASA